MRPPGPPSRPGHDPAGIHGDLGRQWITNRRKVDHAGAAAKEEARQGRREAVQLGDELEVTVTVSSGACERRVGLTISNPLGWADVPRSLELVAGPTLPVSAARTDAAGDRAESVIDAAPHIILRLGRDAAAGDCVLHFPACADGGRRGRHHHRQRGPKLRDALQTSGTALSEGTTTTTLGVRHQAEVQIAIGGGIYYTPGLPYTDTP